MLKALESFSSWCDFKFLNNSFLVVISWWCSKWLTIWPKLWERRSKLTFREIGDHLKWKWDYWLLAISIHKKERVSDITFLTSAELFPLMTWYLKRRPLCVWGKNWLLKLDDVAPALGAAWSSGILFIISWLLTACWILETATYGVLFWLLSYLTAEYLEGELAIDWFLCYKPDPSIPLTFDCEDGIGSCWVCF